jgi:hypothetical protein
LISLLPDFLLAEDKRRQVEFMIRQWGRPHMMGRFDGAKACRELGLQYIPLEQMLVEGATTLNLP